MKNKIENNKFVSGALWLGISAIIVKIIGVAYKIPLSYLLGDEGMGFFNSAYTVYTFFYILGSAGIPKAIAILIAGANTVEAEEKIYVTGFRTFFSVGVFLTILFLALSSPISMLIGTNRSLYSILAIAPSIFFVSATGVIRGYFNGKTEFSGIAIAELIGAVSKLVLGLVFAYTGIKFGLELEIISSLAILGITIGSFFSFIYLILKAGIKRERVRYDRRVVREILKISLPLTISASVNGLVGVIDLAMVIRGLSDAGYSENVSTVLYGNYSTLAVPMFSLVVALLTPFAASMLPILTKSYSLGNNEDFSHRLSEFTNAIALIFVPAFFAFLFFSRECLTLLFEEGSAVLGASMLTVLSPSVIFFALLLILNTTLEARGEIRVPVISLTVGAIIKGIVGVILLERTELGILSAPIGTTVSYATSFLISYFYVSKKSPIKIKNKSGVITVLFICGACSVASLIMKKYLNFYLVNRVGSALILGFYALTYLLLVWFLCFKRLNFQEKIGILHKKRQ